ncbi:transposase family protein [Kineosporia babensis]|uniref:transposase family protein n=1 Tax=Kineosporia babensis TaxID=499548 RepID=UPI0038B29C4B
MCPACGSVSDRVHGWCTRWLKDLAGAGRKVLVELRSRRMLCSGSGCGQKTFRGQVPDLTRRWAPAHDTGNDVDRRVRYRGGWPRRITASGRGRA